MSVVTVIGGGLAGSEAAWQLAQRGHQVKLYEMRPARSTGAHVSDRLAELVCSNSLGSKLIDRATGLLQHEAKLLRSLLIEQAEACAVPAGGALAVDRDMFSQRVTEALASHPLIEIVRQEVTHIPEGPTIIASGPLTSLKLSEAISQLIGQDYLYFYDALSPIVTLESIDMSIAYFGNRYERGESAEGDYINCPLNREEYRRFVEALCSAERIELRDFEREDAKFFEGCLPIEEIARRGEDALAYGPMRPVGLVDPRTGKRPYAVVQLRRDNLAGSLYNIVGFQTNIKWSQQREILRMIPGLQAAEFVRLGQMHRNTFINSPSLLNPTMQFRTRADLYFAGQIMGIEGYVGNIITGIVAAINLSRQMRGMDCWIPVRTSMIGALCHYVTHTDPKHFQPMKANFGIMPELDVRLRGKIERKQAYSERAIADLQADIAALKDDFLSLTT
ncbi:MAG: FADH(2)-oxidizing methylenetetrahydrofolate--tRNA-(uracil(54)-C(5))-methyltransferase TrmFO [Anaerolineae bacterium]|nr:FADH(2)-oxidizing methylenetetrahydrofolate--tRNA-(uracil(54)-C(5))-methyltransferase TrmFO [Anaerolineae bacterium]